MEKVASTEQPVTDAPAPVPNSEAAVDNSQTPVKKSKSKLGKDGKVKPKSKEKKAKALLKKSNKVASYPAASIVRAKKHHHHHHHHLHPKSKHHHKKPGGHHHVIIEDPDVPHFGHRYLEKFDDRATKCSKIKFSCAFDWLVFIAGAFLFAFVRTFDERLINYNETAGYFLVLAQASVLLTMVVDLIGITLLKFNRFTQRAFVGYLTLMASNALVTLFIYLEVITEREPSRHDLVRVLNQEFSIQMETSADIKWVPSWLNSVQEKKECCGISSWEDFMRIPNSFYARHGSVPYSCCTSATCKQLSNEKSMFYTDDPSPHNKSVTDLLTGPNGTLFYVDTCYRHILEVTRNDVSTFSRMLLAPMFFLVVEVVVFGSFYVRRARNFIVNPIEPNLTRRSVSSVDILQNREEGLSMVTIPRQGPILSPEEIEQLRQIQLHHRICLPERYWTSEDNLRLERQNFSMIPNVNPIVGPPLTGQQLEEVAWLEEKRLQRVKDENEKLKLEYLNMEDDVEQRVLDKMTPEEKFKKARTEGRPYQYEFPKIRPIPITPKEKAARAREDFLAEVWPWEPGYSPRRTNVIAPLRPTRSYFVTKTKSGHRDLHVENNPETADTLATIKDEFGKDSEQIGQVMKEVEKLRHEEEVEKIMAFLRPSPKSKPKTGKKDKKGKGAMPKGPPAAGRVVTRPSVQPTTVTKRPSVQPTVAKRPSVQPHHSTLNIPDPTTVSQKPRTSDNHLQKKPSQDRTKDGAGAAHKDAKTFVHPTVKDGPDSKKLSTTERK